MVTTRSSVSASASTSASALVSISTASNQPSRTSHTRPKPKPKPKSRPEPPSTSGVKGSTKFPYDLPYPSLCLCTHPMLYRTGVGEQGVLMVEPYKSELLPHWRFKDPPTATASASKLHSIFLSYLDQRDFVGADMARKFIQMGYTRARRYANHKGGKKYTYASNGEKKQIARLDLAHQDPQKVQAASVFKTMLDDQVWTNQDYLSLRNQHIEWAKCAPWPDKEADQVKKAILKDPGKQRLVRKW